VTFHETQLPGVWLIELDPRTDERGFLARTYSAARFGERGLNTVWPECNVSYTRIRGTLRGMHFQAAPHEETKLIRCSAGAIYDVLVDVRRSSPTYGSWQAFELTERNNLQLYVPGGIAHGLQTLADDTQVSYQMSTAYVPELARGIRHDDPAVGITWPLAVTQLSQRDRELPLLSALQFAS
jgi:dTDP-4-dehydrorhamnose 3,5-epimerase